jgi:hypothetical protein
VEAVVAWSATGGLGILAWGFIQKLGVGRDCKVRIVITLCAVDGTCNCWSAFQGPIWPTIAPPVPLYLYLLFKYGDQFIDNSPIVEGSCGGQPARICGGTWMTVVSATLHVGSLMSSRFRVPSVRGDRKHN